MLKELDSLAAAEGLVVAFAVIGGVMALSHLISRRLTLGRIHGSASSAHALTVTM